MASVKKSETLNAFKVAYKVVRDNSKEIYKAFGFKHLSDATQYYVHPDNQSYSGTTTLCQPIGEAIILFAIVVDPAHDELFCDKVALEKTGAFLNWPSVVLSDMWNALRIITRAQTIHECLHVLYTDFPPKAASEALCDTKLKKKILAHIANIIEDAYIEAVGCSVYDNMEFYLRFGRVSRLFASHPSEGTASRSMKEENEKTAVDLEVKHKLDLVMEFLNVVCTDLLYPMLDPEEPSEELKPYIEQAKPIYLQGSMAPSPDERYAHSKQVFEIIMPLISVSRATALVLVLGMLQPIAIVLVIAIALSAWLAHRMAKKVVEPLNKLNLEKPMENEAYEELSPLLHRIHAQHSEIKSQIRTLKRKQDEFDQITGNMKEGLVLLDSMGRIISINPAARTLFGAGIACVGEDFLTIDRKQNMRLALEEAKTQGHADFRAKENGREYQFDLSRIDSDGNSHGMVILAFDVTEQVNAEKHRQEFTANVSHELKTPLQSIIGSAELMENGIVKAEDVPHFVGHIRKEASRLVFLIDDIILLTELDEGAEMPHEDVSLKVLAEEVCETLADAAKLKDVSLEVTGDDGVVNGVCRLLYEVVYNLCDNAIKYNNPGGSVKVNVAQKPGEVLLSVQDTGIGISPEHQDKVFERFYRVDKSHSKQSGGTGLGLSIVKHAVQYHHGKIAVESELNKGTTISVLFDTRS